MPKSIVRLFFLFLLLLIAAVAQESTGSISGTVTDPTGASVPNAAITVTNEQTGVERKATSNGSGLFVITNLSVGNYRLTAEAPGFKQYQATQIRVDVNDRLSIPVNLVIGGTREVVSVNESGVQLQTQSAELSNLVGARETQALPLNGRVFSQLVMLSPGVVSENGTIGNGVGISSDTTVSINGSQSNSNVWLLDGQSNMDVGSNAQNVVTPPLDALEEFKVLRSNYSAEFGGGTGGVINVVTKQGTRDFHGTVYEYFRNDKLDANDFFLNQQGQPRNELRFNNFGYTLGGPFWIPGVYNKDKTKDFFFASYEGRRNVTGNAVQDNVPTAAERTGDLTDLGEGIIPVSRINPNALATLQRYPLPNATGSFNFVASLPTGTTDDVQLYRWDHNITDKAMLMARIMTEKQSLGNINNQLWADDNFPSVSSDWTFSALNSIVKLTNVITPTFVNEFQFGYTNNYIHFQTSAKSDPTLASRGGFTYSELFPETSGSFPTVNGMDGFGTLSHQAPFTNREAVFQWQDAVSWTLGKHSIRTGFSIGRGRKTEPANGGSDPTAGTMTFNSFADLLLGNLAQYQEEQTLNPVYDRWHDYAIYFQDTWKATSHLTLDLGLRWQYLGQTFSAHNNIANFYPGMYDASQCSSAAIDPSGLVDPTMCNTMNGIVTPESSGIPGPALVRNHPNGWEPRGGIAWSPAIFHDKLVYRMGGGIFHGRDAISQTSALGQLPPFDRTASLTGVNVTSLAPFDPDLPQPPTQLHTLEPKYDIPVNYQYSAGVQYSINSDTIFALGYAGSHQIHQGVNVDINQVPSAYFLDVYNYQSSGGATGISPDTVRPYLGYSDIFVNSREAVTRYNSMQISLERRLKRGLQFQVAYTLSHMISTGPNQDTEGGSKPIQNAYDLAAEKSFGTQDQPHSLSINSVWEVPAFKNSGNGFLKNTLGGWQLNGIYTFRSGLPQNVCLDEDIVGLGNGTNVCQRPDVVSNPNLSSGNRSPNEFFDTSAFQLQAPGTFGNAGRNIIRGPGINSFDLSLFKDFTLPHIKGLSGSENPRLQFRTEFFNAFNHTQWAAIDTTFVPADNVAGSGASSSSPFGSVSAARDPRQIQFALKFLF
ncbi:MAG TPA: carboxypeptidase regulatory-like domain-containing protein [Bryobacteraceae bacterium]|nr:carboxypeptidase regulatory-like domain-containing protein [Bryobacteraceae bacterium]